MDIVQRKYFRDSKRTKVATDLLRN